MRGGLRFLRCGWGAARTTVAAAHRPLTETSWAATVRWSSTVAPAGDIGSTSLPQGQRLSAPAIPPPPPPPPPPRRAEKKKSKAAASRKIPAAPEEVAAASPTHLPSLPRPRAPGDVPFAYRSFRDVTPAPAFKKAYASLEPNEHVRDVVLRVAGRVCGIRHMGAILFITIRSRGDTLQVIRQVADGCSRQDLRALKETLRMGDIIGATGSPGRTKKGELSLYATQVQVLSPYVCADQSICPQLNGFSTVADPDIRYRYRFLDMMTNPDTIRGFQKRHAVLKALRNFLDERDFTEVETPMLHEVPSGANAKPFTTHHEANDTTLYLRVAPELYLKQCVVGGMERVYEIGRVFRNEDADRSHNPEFTSCECYAAYQTYEDLIPFTEDLLRRLAVAANGTTKLTVESVRTKEAVEINFDAPFRRVSAYDAVQAEVGVKLPPADELHSPRGLAYLSAILLRYNIPLPSVRTASKMFDKLISYFITDRVVEPTFVMDHPVCMSPLAKAHDQRKGLSERFELFINGVEYCNAYSELNDPVEQYRRFQQQLVDKQTGDEEAMPVDETFLKALQAGLPPTAGWGLGVDRLMTLLQQSATIRDTIMCPLLRTDATSRDGKRRRKAAGQFPFSPRAATFALHCLEEEMRRRGMPSKGCEAVRELHHFILQIQRHTKPIPLDTAEVARRRNESRKWAENMTMILLQVFCGRSSR